MKWIKYQILQSAIGEQIVLANKKVGYNNENLAIAQKEAYDGYEIIDDEQSYEKEPMAVEFGGTGAKTAEQARANLGAAPSGFGLGETPPIIYDANNATKPGFYRFNGISCANIPSAWQYLYGTMIVSEGTSFLEQVLLAQDKIAKRTIDISTSAIGEWVDISPSAFAPSGYGLGEAASWELVNNATDLNDVIRTGWYVFTSDNANRPFDTGVLLVMSRHMDGKFVWQIAFMDSGDGSRIQVRFRVSGNWQSWKAWHPDSFAPSGYGLVNDFKTVTTIAELNTYTYNCWVRYESSAPLIEQFTTLKNAIIRVDSHTSNVGHEHCTQTAYPAYDADYAGCVLQRYCADGTWSEWEWVNPPLSSNVEYRTIERHRRSPVYVCNLQVGYIEKEATIPHGLSIKTCLGIEFFNQDNHHTNDGGLTHVKVDSTNIVFSAAWPAGGARFVLKYTKP